MAAYILRLMFGKDRSRTTLSSPLGVLWIRHVLFFLFLDYIYAPDENFSRRHIEYIFFSYYHSYMPHELETTIRSITYFSSEFLKRDQQRL